MKTAVLIARKDLRIALRDKSIFILGLIAPLALATIFGLILNPITEAEFTAEYVVVDLDGGPIAEAFGEALAGLESAEFATIRYVDTVEEAEEQVEVGSDAFAEEGAAQANAAFIIPEGMSEKVLAGESAELQVIGAQGSELAGQVAYSVAQSFASELAAVQVAVTVALPVDTEPDPAQVAGLAQEAAQVPNPVSVDDVSTSTKLLDQGTSMAAGMAVMFLFFTVTFGVTGLLEEKRLGTMDRLMAAPINRRTVIYGKAITTFILGFSATVVLWIASTLILGADWGHPVGVLILILAVVLSALGILAVVAATAKTQEQAVNFGAMIAMILAFLGGTFFPVSQVGGWIETLSLATPHAWFLRGLGDLQGGDIFAIWPSVVALLLFGLVTGAIAWPFLTRGVER